MIDLEGKQVVYWIGAGASAKALPIVDQMPTAFDLHMKKIPNFRQKSRAEYGDYLKRLGKRCQQFGTVDTYARSLFLQNDHEALNELKLHLSMFFLLEQFLDKGISLGPSPREPLRSYVKAKRDVVDTRYMGWLAVLLTDQIRIAPKAKVISWNYDLQVEHALAIYGKYAGIKELLENGETIIHPSPASHVKGKLTGDPFLIHLNGIAGLINEGDEMLEFIDSLELDALVDLKVRHLFKLYAAEDGREKLCAAFKENFTFAWEGTSLARMGIQRAMKYMIRADVLVVIGYSFPSFNRKVDQQLVSSFFPNQHEPSRKKIIIQNPNLSEETFRHIFGLKDRGKYTSELISVESDTSQFVMPPEIF